MMSRLFVDPAHNTSSLQFGFVLAYNCKDIVYSKNQKDDIWKVEKFPVKNHHLAPASVHGPSICHNLGLVEGAVATHKILFKILWIEVFVSVQDDPSFPSKPGLRSFSSDPISSISSSSIKPIRYETPITFRNS
jgi:hypothetical protein